MTPTLERIDREYRGQLKVCQVDFDANPVLRKRFGIHYVPILLLFARGELVAGFSGAVSAERIIRDINENSGCVPSSPAENKREMTYEGGK